MDEEPWVNTPTTPPRLFLSLIFPLLFFPVFQLGGIRMEEIVTYGAVFLLISGKIRANEFLHTIKRLIVKKILYFCIP